MRVWILQTGEPIHLDNGDPRPMRAMNLADTLVKYGCNVVIWTSMFSHSEKAHRILDVGQLNSINNIEYKLIDSPGYKKHIGIMRLLDHAVMAINLSKMLRSEKHPPDVVFIGYPPIEVAYVLSRYCIRLNIPYIIDVKDMWPDIFLNAVPERLKYIFKVVLLPYYYMAKFSFRNSTAISVISTNFKDWLADFCVLDKRKEITVLPLVAPAVLLNNSVLESAQNWWIKQGVLNDDISFVFIGSLTASFDFDPIIFAAKEFKRRGIVVKFIICGSGPLYDSLKSIAIECDNLIVPGFVNKYRGEFIKRHAAAMLAPYKATYDFSSSLPNKVIDSLQAGRPIIGSLSGSLASMLRQASCAETYDSRCNDSLYQVINNLLIHPDRLDSMSEAAYAIYKSEFDFERHYSSFAKKITHYASSYKKHQSFDRARYDKIASLDVNDTDVILGSAGVPIAFREPYIVYENIIKNKLNSSMTVLELGAGRGMHTGVLLESGAQVHVIDISPKSIELLRSRFAEYSNLFTVVADIEKLPFEDSRFDLICCAGSISYGANCLVFSEIYRLLKPGGRFICVDSLNNNPIYRFNRWIQVHLGLRTRETTVNMMTLEKIYSLTNKFKVESYFFGGFQWFYFAMRLVMSESIIANLLKTIDSRFNVCKSAFKFVLDAEKVGGNL